MFSGSFLRFHLNFCFLDDPDPDDGFNYKQMMVRDERRFKMADKDGDLIATKEEFTAFLHPEEYDYMKDIVVQVGRTRVPSKARLLLLSPMCLLGSVLGPVPGCAGGYMQKLRSITVFLQCLRLIIKLSIK